jgi:hypothetical protein
MRQRDRGDGGVMSRLTKGDVVAFDFPIEHGGTGKTIGRRVGVGVIADDETNYSCWPPGRTVRIASSDDYKPGTLIAVATHNLRRVRSR